MTLLVGGLLWLLVVLVGMRWAERGVEEATARAAQVALWGKIAMDARIVEQAVADFHNRHRMLTERLLDCDDPSAVAEGLGLVAPRYRERPISLMSFAPADRVLLEEAERASRG